MEMIRYLVFDIETVSDGRLIQKVRYPEQDDWSPQKAIAQYGREIEEETQGKTDFIPSTYHLPISVALVGVRADYSIAGLYTLDRPLFRPQKISQKFWELWRQRQFPTFVTYNGRGFDLPVLEQSAFRYGLSVPEWFQNTGAGYQQPRNRFNSSSHFDLMDFLTNQGASRATGGLNLAATLLSKPGKLETKGSMVQELWDKGEKIRIDDYCLCDALDTYFVFLRTQVMLGKLSLADEHHKVLDAQKMLEQEQEKYPILQKYLDHFKLWSPPSEQESGFLENS